VSDRIQGAARQATEAQFRALGDHPGAAELAAATGAITVWQELLDADLQTQVAARLTALRQDVLARGVSRLQQAGRDLQATSVLDGQALATFDRTAAEIRAELGSLPEAERNAFAAAVDRERVARLAEQAEAVFTWAKSRIATVPTGEPVAQFDAVENEIRARSNLLGPERQKQLENDLAAIRRKRMRRQLFQRRRNNSRTTLRRFSGPWSRSPGQKRSSLPPTRNPTHRLCHHPSSLKTPCRCDLSQWSPASIGKGSPCPRSGKLGCRITIRSPRRRMG